MPDTEALTPFLRDSYIDTRWMSESTPSKQAFETSTVVSVHMDPSSDFVPVQPVFAGGFCWLAKFHPLSLNLAAAGVLERQTQRTGPDMGHCPKNLPHPSLPTGPSTGAVEALRTRRWVGKRTERSAAMYQENDAADDGRTSLSVLSLQDTRSLCRPASGADSGGPSNHRCQCPLPPPLPLPHQRVHLETDYARG